ncbi:MAG: transposase [Candidatus Omnitrophica bacterium]|nr:transposase [Candidatus Omnitrophota bacterium]
MIVINRRAQASGAPTISQIIRSFKSKSTMEYLKHIKQNNLNISGKIWQRSSYDYTIRNEESLNRIREYIVNKPAKWAKEKENIEHFLTNSPKYWAMVQNNGRNMNKKDVLISTSSQKILHFLFSRLLYISSVGRFS